MRELAQAEARAGTGGKASPTALELLANIDAMQVAVDRAATAEPFTTNEITAIHRRLMAGAPNTRIGSQIRTRQNWIGGNDYDPCDDAAGAAATPARPLAPQ